jgi:hypothetical protein
MLCSRVTGDGGLRDLRAYIRCLQFLAVVAAMRVACGTCLSKAGSHASPMSVVIHVIAEARDPCQQPFVLQNAQRLATGGPCVSVLWLRWVIEGVGPPGRSFPSAIC